MGLFTRFTAGRAAPVAAIEGARLGDLQGPVGRIDEQGGITLDGSGRSLQWGVLAGERWRRANDERAVRQHRIDDTPVYETWLRVPTGDVIQRVGVVNDGHEPVLALEFENASADAVLLAVIATLGPGERPRFQGDTTAIELDGEPWLRAERPAQAVVGAPAWSEIEAHPADAAGGTIERSAQGALLVAVPHRQRVAVAFGPTTRMPTVDEIVSGWKAIVSRAASIDVPDPHLGPAWRRIVGDLVLAAGEPFGRDDALDSAEVAWWLDVAGLHGEADRARAAALEQVAAGKVRGDSAVAVLRALASRDLRAGEQSDLAELAGPLVRLAGSALDRSTVALVQRALRPHAPDAADDAARLLSEATLPEWSATHAGCTPVTAAAAGVVGAVVHDNGDELDLVPTLEPGREVDVRGVVTTLGRLSYSIRWHGDRPALLWELESVGDQPPVSIRARSADPDWESTEPRGETLLRMPDSAL